MNNIADALPASLVNAGPGTPQPKNTLGKDDFMKLLMAQLRNQDPLNPMDQQAFVAQLAQFGSLEQLTNIGTGIQHLRTGVGEGSKLQALGMIGKQIQASGNEVSLTEGQGASLVFTPKEGIVPIKAMITDAGGKIVREMDLAATKETAGGTIPWDGKDQDGAQLPAGKYSFRVQGVDNNGQGVELSSELTGKVTGVDVDGQNPILIVEGAMGKTRMELSKVRQVSVESAAPASSAMTSPAKATPAPAPIAPPVPVIAAEPSEDGEEVSMGEAPIAFPSKIPPVTLERSEP